MRKNLAQVNNYTLVISLAGVSLLYSFKPHVSHLPLIRLLITWPALTCSAHGLPIHKSLPHTGMPWNAAPPHSNMGIFVRVLPNGESISSQQQCSAFTPWLLEGPGGDSHVGSVHVSPHAPRYLMKRLLHYDTPPVNGSPALMMMKMMLHRSFEWGP